MAYMGSTFFPFSADFSSRELPRLKLYGVVVSKYSIFFVFDIGKIQPASFLICHMFVESL